MKKILIGVGVAVVVLGIVALAVVFFSLNSIVKKGVETAGPMITKVDVKLGAAELSPFSGSGRLTKFFVGNPEGYKTPSAIQLDDIKVGVSLGSLMSDTIVVNEVNVQGAQITLEGIMTDNNLSKIMDNINGASTSQPKPKNAPPSPGTSSSSKKFIVKDLVIAGTKVNLDLSLPGLGHKALTISIPDLHLTDIGTAENGVTAEQLVQKIMKPLFNSIIKSATEAVTKLATGELNKDTLNKAAKGVTDLFKK